MAKTRFIDVLCDGTFITTLRYTFTPPHRLAGRVQRSHQEGT